jgi:hypothetical protein
VRPVERLGAEQGDTDAVLVDAADDGSLAPRPLFVTATTPLA